MSNECLEGFGGIELCVWIAGDGLVNRGRAIGECREMLDDEVVNLGGAAVRDGSVCQRVHETRHLGDVEERLGPIGREHHAALLLGGVSYADFVVDVSVGDGDVGTHEMGNHETLEHLLDDERAEIHVGSHRLISEL